MSAANDAGFRFAASLPQVITGDGFFGSADPAGSSDLERPQLGTWPPTNAWATETG
jgi:hypothetical protein